MVPNFSSAFATTFSISSEDAVMSRPSVKAPLALEFGNVACYSDYLVTASKGCESNFSAEAGRTAGYEPDSHFEVQTERMVL